MTEREPPSPFALLRRAELIGGAQGDPSDPLDVLLARGVLTVELVHEGQSFRVLHRARYASRISVGNALEYLIPSGVSQLGEPIDEGEVVRAELAWREAALRSAGRAIEAATRAACLDHRLTVDVCVRDGLRALAKAGRAQRRLTASPNAEKTPAPTDARSASADRQPQYPRPNHAPPPARIVGALGTVAYVDGKFVDLPTITAEE